MTDEQRAIAALGIGGALTAGATAAGLHLALAAQPGDPGVLRFWVLGALGALTAPLLMWLPVRQVTPLRHRQVFELYLLDVALLTVLSLVLPFSWGLLSVLLYAVPPLCAARAWVRADRRAVRWSAACLALLALAAPGVTVVQNAVAAAGVRQGLDWMTPAVGAPGVRPGPFRTVDGGTRELLHYPVAARDRIPLEGEPWDPGAALGVVTVHPSSADQCARLRVPVTVQSVGQMTPPGTAITVLHDAPHRVAVNLYACGDPADPDGYEVRRPGVVITVSGGPGAPRYTLPSGHRSPAGHPDPAGHRRLLLGEVRGAHRASDAELRDRAGTVPHSLAGWLLM